MYHAASPFPRLVILCCAIVLSLCPPFSAAINLRCKDSNSTATGAWCCPDTYSLDTSVQVPNPPLYNYTDAFGVPFASIPSCTSCANSTVRCIDSYASNNGEVCCPSNYRCIVGDTARRFYCVNGDYFLARSVLRLPAAPLADMDLCRFRTAANGSYIPGSPCAPQFKCEAYSQTQYLCQTCSDPRIGPPGICNSFCRAGFYCPDGYNPAIVVPYAIAGQICPVGRYCPLNSTSPIACTVGQNCSMSGLVAAEDCQGGYYCQDSSRPPVQCPAGSYCPPGSWQPIPCSTGQYCPQNSAVAINFLPGYYFSTNASTSYQCPRGYFCPGDTTEPIKCMPGQLCDSWGLAQSFVCANGSFCDGSFQYPCSWGQYCEAGSASPTPCPQGTVSQTWSASSKSVCIRCDIWRTNNGDHTQCSRYSPVFYGVISGAAMLCILWCTFVSVMANRIIKLKQKYAAEAAEADTIKQQQEADATRVKFEANRLQLKSEVLTRLMRDLRTDLKLLFPHANQVQESTTGTHAQVNLNREGGETHEQASPMPEAAASPAAEAEVVSAANPQSPLQAYEQFLQQLLSVQFDSASGENQSDLFTALNILAANPEVHSPIELHNTLMGLRSLVIEEFPKFLSTLDSTSSEASAAELQALRTRLVKELAHHVKAWHMRARVLTAATSSSLQVPLVQASVSSPPLSALQPVTIHSHEVSGEVPTFLNSQQANQKATVVEAFPMTPTQVPEASVGLMSAAEAAALPAQSPFSVSLASQEPATPPDLSSPMGAQVQPVAVLPNNSSSEGVSSIDAAAVRLHIASEGLPGSV